MSQTRTTDVGQLQALLRQTYYKGVVLAFLCSEEGKPEEPGDLLFKGPGLKQCNERQRVA